MQQPVEIAVHPPATRNQAARSQRTRRPAPQVAPVAINVAPAPAAPAPAAPAPAQVVRNQRGRPDAELSDIERANELETMRYFTNLLLTQGLYWVMSVLAFLQTATNMDIKPIFVALFGLIFFNRLFFRFHRREHKHAMGMNGTRFQMSIAIAAGDLLTVILLGLWKLGLTGSYGLILLPLLCTFFIRNIQYCFRGSEFSCVRLDDVVQLYIHTFLTIQLIAYIGRSAGLISWPWNMIFIFYWMLFAIWLIFTVVLTIFVLKQILFKILGVWDAVYFKGILWTTIFSAGWLGLSLLLVITIINYEQEASSYELYYELTKKFGLVFLSLNLALTIAFRHSLIEYFKNLQFDLEDEEEDEVANPSDAENVPNSSPNAPPRRARRKRVQSVAVAKPLTLPMFLRKISSAYFRVMTPMRKTRVTSPVSVKSDNKTKMDKLAFSFQIAAMGVDNVLETEIKRAEEGSPMSNQSENHGNCVICFSNFANGVLLNCGHGGVCIDCAVELFTKKKGCHLCRKPITSVLQISWNGKDKVVKVESKYELTTREL